MDLAPLLPEGQRASRVFRGRGELIDHLFRSRALLGSVTEVASARRDAPVSDHAMVCADLELA